VRIALFASPSRFSELALRALSPSHEVVALVLPEARKGGLRETLRRAFSPAGSPLETLGRERGIPTIRLAREAADDGRESLRRVAPDLLCAAIYPHRITPDVIALAPLGALNAHPSLLPRHRGPLPIFWTYHADDRRAGVTIHHLDQRLDAGDIVRQDGFDLPRGYPAARLDSDLAELAAALLKESVDRLARHEADRIPQDESAATRAPFLEPGARMIDFERWDVERVWHFLSALSPRYREPLTDDFESAVAYTDVAGFVRESAGARPGEAKRHADGWLLHCRGGTVHLLGRPRAKVAA